jgi:hypothetical protein
MSEEVGLEKAREVLNKVVKGRRGKRVRFAVADSEGEADEGKEREGLNGEDVKAAMELLG